MKINVRVACKSCTKQSVCKYTDDVGAIIKRVDNAVLSAKVSPVAVTIECTEREQIRAGER